MSAPASSSGVNGSHVVAACRPVQRCLRMSADEPGVDIGTGINERGDCGHHVRKVPRPVRRHVEQCALSSTQSPLAIRRVVANAGCSARIRFSSAVFPRESHPSRRWPADHLREVLGTSRLTTAIVSLSSVDLIDHPLGPRLLQGESPVAGFNIRHAVTDFRDIPCLAIAVRGSLRPGHRDVAAIELEVLGLEALERAGERSRVHRRPDSLGGIAVQHVEGRPIARQHTLDDVGVGRGAAPLG